MIVALGGLVSSLIGGVISDRLANPPVKKDGSADRPRARAWVPAIGATHTHTPVLQIRVHRVIKQTVLRFYTASRACGSHIICTAYNRFEYFHGTLKRDFSVI